MGRILFCILCFITLQTFSQTGPAGVDNSTNNVLWLKADAGTSSATNSVAISSWSDQSGNGNHVYQATANKQPLYMSAVINGYPAIWFDNVSNTNDKMLGADSPTLDNTSGYTFFMVSRPQNFGDAHAIVSKRTTVSVNQSFMHFYYTSNALNSDIQTTNDRYATSTTFTTNTNYLIDQLYDGSLTDVSRCKTYIAGALDKTAKETSSSVPDNASPLIIGSTDSADGRPFGGYIAEVILYRKAVNNAERYIVDNYLSSKYAIPLSANDLYAGDLAAKGSYYMDVAGIGTDATGSSATFSANIAAGMSMMQASGFGNGDYVLAGHATPVNSVDSADVNGLPGTKPARWSRIWYWDVTDAGTNALVNVSFNLVAGGFSSAPNVGAASDYSLVYRSGTSGTWTVVATASSASGQTVYFTNVNTSAYSDGYYTIATQERSASPLPIELIDFSALMVGDKVDLKWETATETNNAYFSLEKSSDGRNFKKFIGVPGAGNSQSYKEYYETDYQPYNGLTYYRLKQVDANGKFSYSAIRAVNSSLKKKVVFYPNPIEKGDVLKADINGYKGREIAVVLRDMSGREYFSKLVITGEDSQTITISTLDDLPSATYIITASSEGELYYKKITVK